MFTGIIETIGVIRSVEQRGGNQRCWIDSADLDLALVRLGDSIAVNGVCLTVVERDGHGFAADVSNETLSCTTLSSLRPASRVNIEQALLPTTRLGGHLVSGHVDAVGRVVALQPDGGSTRLGIDIPEPLRRYVAVKGSVCVDGTSLTVNRISASGFEANIIPHTMVKTVIGDYRPGVDVNIEVDLIARYLERLLSGPDAGRGYQDVSHEFLVQHGYIATSEDI
ncbi:MAG: riboflavin synthase [Gammaproteobacteria bacterium]|nr:riboflavin synthase [Gammaproteobacteria bacterium]